MVASFCACENAADGASTATRAATPSHHALHHRLPFPYVAAYCGGGVSPRIFAGLILNSFASSCSVNPFARSTFAHLASASG